MADDPGYTLTSERLGFRMLEEHDFDNLVKLDMDPEVRAFFPGGISTPELLRERIIRSRTCFLEYEYPLKPRDFENAETKRKRVGPPAIF